VRWPFAWACRLSGKEATTPDTPSPLPLKTRPYLPAPASGAALAGRCVAALLFAVASFGQPSAFASSADESYVVQPGDTLTSIAAATGVPIDRLVELNDLASPDTIIAGDTLRLSDGQPGPALLHSGEGPRTSVTPGARGYEVEEGDTIYGIARKMGVEPAAIIAANDLASPDHIVVGERLVLPAAATPPPPPVADRAPPASDVVGGRPAVPDPTATPQPTAVTTRAPASGVAGERPMIPEPAASRPPSPVNNVASPAGTIAIALQYRGAPYVYGGVTPNGFDCSGFVHYVFDRAGTPIAREIALQYESGVHPAKNQLLPGDLVFFRDTYAPGLSHNGIYVGHGEFIHAAGEDDGVTVSQLSTPYWDEKWFGATRLRPGSTQQP